MLTQYRPSISGLVNKKEKLINCTFIEIVLHSLNFMCHVHNRHAIEMTEIWLE